MHRKTRSSSESSPSGKSTITADPLHEEFGNININRSDGKIHDLKSMFDHVGMHSMAAEKLASDRNASVQPPKQKITKDDRDHPKISVNRSDGVTHDIIQFFKAKSDTSAEVFSQKRTSFTKGASIDLSPKGSSATAVEFLASPKVVRIVHLSDTHNLLDKRKKSAFLPKGDILVHSGDFSNNGTNEEFAEFDEWLASMKDLYRYRVVVLGGRDVKQFGNNWDVMKKKLTNATHVLCHNEAIILGIRFYGVPWHWGHRANMTLRPGAPNGGRFDDIPEGTQVLVTHAPAFQRLDCLSASTGRTHREHWGSIDLLEALRRIRPGLHLHGHVHEARGVLLAEGHNPLTLNSCMADKEKSVLYACPHVIRAERLFETSPTDLEVVVSSNSFSGKNKNMPLTGNSNFWHFTLDSLET